MKKILLIIPMFLITSLYAYPEKIIFENIITLQEKLFPYVKKALQRASKLELQQAKNENYNCKNVEIELISNEILQKEIIPKLKREDYNELKKRYINIRCETTKLIGNDFTILNKNLTNNEKNEIKQISEKFKKEITEATIKIHKK